MATAGTNTQLKTMRYVRTESNRFLFLLAFFIPLYSLSLRIFVEWSWYKVIPFVLLVAIFMRRRRRCPPEKAVFEWAMILICYMFAVTAINYFLNIQSGRFQYATEAGQYNIRTYGQMIVQLVMIVAALSQLFLFPYFIRTKEDVNAFVRGFIDGNIFSTLLGMIQYVVYRFNLPFGCLTVWSEGSYFRMSGLGGEPRHFGAFNSLALILLIANYFSNRPLAIKNGLLKSGILAAGLFYSLSTSSWLGFLGGLIIILLCTLSIKRIAQIIAISLFCVAFLISNDNFNQLVHYRLFNRMESFNHFLYFAPKDGIALKLIRNNATVCLLGSGSGGSDFYVMNPTFLGTIPDVILRAGIIRKVYEGEVGNSLSPSSFFIKFWVEYGIVGIALLLALVGSAIKQIRTMPQYSRFVLLISLAVFVASVPSSMLLAYVYFSLLSVLYGFYYRQSRMRLAHSREMLGKADEQ